MAIYLHWLISKKLVVDLEYKIFLSIIVVKPIRQDRIQLFSKLSASKLTVCHDSKPESLEKLPKHS